MTQQQIKQCEKGKNHLIIRFIKWMFFGMAAGFLVALCKILAGEDGEYVTLLTYSVAGGIAGYLLFTIKTILEALVRGVRVVSPALKHERGKVQIVTIMEGFQKDFVYEEFEKQVVSLLTELLHCKNLEELSWCRQKVREKDLENIVQCEYCGCIEFYGFSREKGCLLELGVYMKNQYCRGKRTSWRNDVFRVAVSWEEDGSMVVERFWRK